MNSAFLILLLLVVDIFAINITSQNKTSISVNEKMPVSNKTVPSKDKFKFPWGLIAIGAAQGAASAAASIYQSKLLAAQGAASAAASTYQGNTKG
ncbi:hypothetical protein ANCCAN_11941 [Ancylostoma caninum]|uniref:Uncharacterized protein n=1 Tax=Ancylostoma caninum TaxID=29170 RepID=A0A368GCH8_ANCCA|nr:hypothetical protein ANCCAN_11941 [Ancylostoma caninum]